MKNPRDLSATEWRVLHAAQDAEAAAGRATAAETLRRLDGVHAPTARRAYARLVRWGLVAGGGPRDRRAPSAPEPYRGRTVTEAERAEVEAAKAAVRREKRAGAIRLEYSAIVRIREKMGEDVILPILDRDACGILLSTGAATSAAAEILAAYTEYFGAPR